MPEQLLSPEPVKPRHIVSYFDHEFASRLSLEQAQDDIREMQESGFTNMVLCVTENDVASEKRQRYLSSVVAHAKDKGIDVWADPWAVGGVFGGEGNSQFRHNGETKCYCNPHVESLLGQWLVTVRRCGIETVFWDEPELHCDEHRNDDVAFLARYTQAAQEMGLTSVVCMCANEANLEHVRTVANLPSVAEIATDPYFPNAFTRVSEEERLAYIEKWAERTREIGKAAGKRSHVWVQGFDVPLERESMIAEHVQAVRNAKMADIALWGFHGCESVPDFIKPGQMTPKAVWAIARSVFESV